MRHEEDEVTERRNDLETFDMNVNLCEPLRDFTLRTSARNFFLNFSPKLNTRSQANQGTELCFEHALPFQHSGIDFL